MAVGDLTSCVGYISTLNTSEPKFVEEGDCTREQKLMRWK